ncbi:MAG: hypothetical protein A2365_03000 [Candidatus Nealsonbacteria bacterium RIFOXYB1_FULL_40_15]|uniref:Bacterial spore germination immunoglobulin-like domain-containing protein n=2 Tax=Candidatus Nealsoniibacteriota TaxID=1817911 RepID=A0A1G2ETT8_9BACT|nr:MAG: hypothetical protein A2365_03000 [Candidatus Nealsonbacteria bacterium RIFOXYB1_FULL_40_15]OGZ29196.1 MAG: hypothetical protein A2427_02855 [Candidatus Nealsonbacteria bacterium RIFOXYC1_FULL_40_7]OGZ29877.1 MAG: hypothetical protein A2562_02035 [Candidatus Nealsonbacteria bacterium RIFOXYD1_FULL_39_11]
MNTKTAIFIVIVFVLIVAGITAYYYWTEPGLASKTGFIEGEAEYPQGDAPEGFKVCAINLENEKEFCFDGAGNYRIEVPEGSYRIIAFYPGSEFKGYYTELAACGMEEGCGSHDIKETQVLPDKTISGVNPSDWHILSGDIRIFSPYSGQEVENSVDIKGEARGGWFFEADFPVKIVNEDGEVLDQKPASAQGDWMTEDFVPFSATPEFSPNSETGKIIFEKANPSGLEENARTVEVPVVFKIDSSREDLAKSKAEAWIRNSAPTYKFDGMNLKFEKITKTGECANCFEAEYSFSSRNAGYGDREGESLAQVIVDHRINISVKNGIVTKAVTDNKYDEIRERFINL